MLDGAKSLAVPTTCGQDLIVEPINGSQLIWKSFTNEGVCWLEAVFDLPKLRLVSTTFESEEDGGNDRLAENLKEIVLQVKKLNSSFLNSEQGFSVKTNLSFPKNWGLGTSSTLINNLAAWAAINPYKLLQNTFGGSGYDIACAQHNTPVLYTRTDLNPIVERVNFNPIFREQLYFVYLNKKQNSREGIQQYKKYKNEISTQLSDISALTLAFLTCETSADFGRLMLEHEQIISKTIRVKSVQEQLFPDYFGQTKSLGAWGGDFILALGNSDTPGYFEGKGFRTVIPYQQLIL